MPATEHQLFEAPTDPNIKVWRYMDFTKLVSILETKSLFFTRADMLGDPFEGSTTQQSIELLRNQVIENGKLLHSSEAIDNPDILVQKVRASFYVLREYTYISCWHMNQYESAAMWGLYTRTNESIAVQTTYQRLFDNLPNQCSLGRIHYIDYNEQPDHPFHPFHPYLYKRKSFAHEQEIRAIIQEWPLHMDGSHILFDLPSNVLPGKSIEVDLMQLIETIYIAPTAPKWFYELVKSIIIRYGLDIPVCQSLLDEKPLF